MDASSGIDVSAVVIARNEEARIGAVLESVIANLREAQAAGLCGPAEVLLVDSASTDRTVEIASRVGVRIVQMRREWPLSAPAARHIGLVNARGRRLFFVDGDFVVDRGFVAGALPHLTGDVAAVAGVDREHRAGSSVLMARLVGVVASGAVREPEGVPIGLYRRDALEQVGGFDPFLRGGEDREVARRLRAAGYRVARVPVPMGEHFWTDSDAMSYVTYFRSVANWSFGDGQVARSLVSGRERRVLLGRYFSARFLINHGIGLSLGAALAALFVPLASPGAWPASALAAGALAAGLLAARARLRSWREVAYALHGVPYSLIRQSGLLLGMVRGARPASDYPRDVLVLREGGAV
ncbi:MAG TPA: glycosyltransferase [Thermoplasmata archaeon]|nr:glycosyltransferase [Thermoplasmata archaeon]